MKLHIRFTDPTQATKESFGFMKRFFGEPVIKSNTDISWTKLGRKTDLAKYIDLLSDLEQFRQSNGMSVYSFIVMKNAKDEYGIEMYNDWRE